MILVLLVFLGGVLTILSPCILPVLPFVFARAQQPFLKSGLPMLAGMALTFTAIASLAAVGGAWAVHVNQYGRILALIMLTAFALTLLSKRLADRIAQPFVTLGNRLLQTSSNDGKPDDESGLLRSLLLGVATGLLWAPCAGPVLGLVLTGAAISGPNTHTTLLLFAYAAGAATSLGVAILAGGRVFAAMKKSLGASEWIRRGLGIAVLLAVAAIALGFDTNVLTRLSLNSTNRLEQSLIEKIAPTANPNNSNGAAVGPTADGTPTAGNAAVAAAENAPLPVEGTLPSLAGETTWLNSPPLTPQALRGKVVVIDFWTYSCINCLRSLPYVRAWYEKYKDYGLVVIGVHAPEFAFEKDVKNVQHAVQELAVPYPVALDNDYAIWKRFNNQYWPAHYFIDAQGNIRGHHFGEGSYDESEQTIRRLLTEAGVHNLPPTIMPMASGVNPSDTANTTNGATATTATSMPSAIQAAGIQAASNQANVKSPETYVGYRRANNFASQGGFGKDKSKNYVLPATLTLNQWGLSGAWRVTEEKAMQAGTSAKIAFRFDARDLHLVLGPAANGKPVHFRVLLDGIAPGANHGVDTDADGNGVVTEQRLYQLIRQSDTVGEHTFSIEFPDGGAQAFAFTFG